MTRNEMLQDLLVRVPIVQTLGMRCDVKGDDMTAILPFNNKLIGNFSLKALHGGAIGTFLELTAMAQLFLESDVEKLPRTINITVDYLRRGRAENLFARAYIVKMGRRMSSVRVEAWQAERSKVVAAMQGHFLLSRPELESQ